MLIRNKKDLNTNQSLKPQFDNLMANFPDTNFFELGTENNQKTKKRAFYFRHLEVSAKQNLNVKESIDNVIAELVAQKR